jgi:DNA-binding winged helix-turn-helix (wHTH) protein
MTPAGQTKEGILFGPFSLIAGERPLTRGGAPVELSGRALNILIALLSNPNEVVSKNDVLSQVWPDVTVDEGSLRFHMANLRKVLGDGQDGPRSIATVPGRGYCFVAPISRSSDQGQALDAAGFSFPHANLHGRMMGMVGRDDDVFKLSALLNAARFVTIVGSGRETLQVEGQHVYRLDALACPPDDTGITAAVAQTFAAPKLFVERAAASGAHLDLSDAETAIVVCTCAGDARRCIFRRRSACH